MNSSSITRRRALSSAAAAPFILTACARNSDAPSQEADLADMDAVAVAQSIKNGDVTALEVVDAAIARAEVANPMINSIVSPYYESAREQAAQTPAGPWFGVPTFVKDLNNVIGQRTTYGSRVFANNIAATQSDFIGAYLGTGLISLGKSATPEFGLHATTETSLSGHARNPWNLDHSAGGSSGGAAALVAARVVPVAHASDGGGSIRIPAACCGLVGLKPSSFRFPEPERPAGRPVRLSEHGIESRTVRDTAAFFAMMEIESDHPAVGFIEGPATTRRKIAFHTVAPTETPVDEDVAAAVRNTAALLAEAGHEVTEIEPPFPVTVGQDFILYWGAGASSAVAGWEEAAGRKAAYNDFEPWTFGLIDYYEARKEGLEDAVNRLAAFAGDWRAAFDDYDILLSPTLASTAPPIGRLSPTGAFPVIFERLLEYSPFTHFANIAGAPAISLPLAQSESGLPIGVMAAAAQGGDAMLIELAYELEEAAPWAQRTPQAFAQRY